MVTKTKVKTPKVLPVLKCFLKHRRLCFFFLHRRKQQQRAKEKTKPATQQPDRMFENCAAAKDTTTLRFQLINYFSFSFAFAPAGVTMLQHL